MKPDHSFANQLDKIGDKKFLASIIFPFIGVGVGYSRIR